MFEGGVVCYSCVVYVFILDCLEEVVKTFGVLAEQGRRRVPVF